jgi:Domain of unknown function (DUF4157)
VQERRSKARWDEEPEVESGSREGWGLTRKTAPAPSKVTRTAAESTTASMSGKRTMMETDAAINPEQALGYSRWLLAEERGWSQTDAGRLPVQRRATDAELQPDQGAMASAFEFLAGSGGAEQLPAELAHQLSESLGLSAARVRLHTDERAAAAAALLHARAFTLGEDIYFAADAYDPSSEAGIELIAHEMAHVAQHQRGARAGSGGDVSRPGDHHELEADELARRFTLERSRRQSKQTTEPRRAAAWGEARGAGEEARSAPRSSAVRLDAQWGAPPIARAASVRPADEASAADSLWGGTIQRKAAAPSSKPAAPAAKKATGGAAPLATVVDLLAAPTFEPTPELAAHIEKAGSAGAQVRVKLGGLSSGGILRVKKAGGRYVTLEDKPQVIPLTHSLFVPLPGLSPVIRVRIGAGHGSAITGYVAPEALAGSERALQKQLGENPEAIGLRGFELSHLQLTNKLEHGTLTLASQKAAKFELGGWVDGTLAFGLTNTTATFDATAQLRARGLKDAELHLSRDAQGQLHGSAELAVDLGDKFTGSARATYDNGDVAIKGELAYHSEKFAGKVGLIVADAAQAEQMVRAQIDPSGLMPLTPASDESGDAHGKKAPKAKKGERAIAGWGELDFAFTEWLTGKAMVAYGPTGHLTVIGKIAPPKRLDLMKTPKSIKQPILPQMNIEASYGLPYIADIHVGIGVSLDATAELGPIYMSDLVVEGIYSTDPTVMNAFSITGALRAQAHAGLELDVKGYAGLRVLKHSVNVGAGIKGEAGIRAYAEARPTLGYRETASPTAGKQGEYYLKGHLEMAAQPVLALGGRLFVELDSPWWSPAPDKTWEWPIGNLEYPLPTQLGVGADIDYVVGSDKWPDVKLSQPSFDASKFVDTMMDDKLPTKSGKSGEQTPPSSWRGVAPTAPTAAPPTVKKTPAPEPKATAGTATKKPRSGKQAPEEKKNVPQTKEKAEQWNAGLEAIGDLRKRAEKDPETSTEIYQHLADLKARHGFTELKADRSGDVWLVDAAMNPAKKDIPINADPNDKGGKGEDGKDAAGAKDGDKKDKDAKDKKKLPLQLPFSLHGEAHTLFVEAAGERLAISMASRKERLAGKYQRFQQTVARYLEHFRTIGEPSVVELLQGEIDRLQEIQRTQIAAHVAKLESISSKEFGDLEAQVTAGANALVAEIVEACAAFNLPDLTPEALKAHADAAEERRWEEAVRQKRQQIQERLEVFVPRIHTLAEELRGELPEDVAVRMDAAVALKYRGSTAKGRRSRGKGFARFDPENFDIDAFIESDVLVWVSNRRTRSGSDDIWVSSCRIAQLVAIENEMVTVVRDLTNNERPISLRLRTTGNVRELQRKNSHEGERHVTIQPPREEQE